MDSSIIFLIALVGILFLLWFARLLFRLQDFKTQLDYINSEIKRGSARSRAFWKRKRRRLWRYFLLHPF